MNKNIFAALLLCFTLAVAGCDTTGNNTPTQNPPADNGQQTPKNNEQEKPLPKEMTLTVYYPNADGSKLVPVQNKVALNGRDKYTAALETMMENSEGRFTVIPKQTKLNSVKVKDGVATVDFSVELKKYFVGGSTGEEMLIGSVVNTLTEFPEVKAVKFLLGGKKIDTLSGHSDLSQPVERMPELL